jgi:hypothetical protein
MGRQRQALAINGSLIFDPALGLAQGSFVFGSAFVLKSLKNQARAP